MRGWLTGSGEGSTVHTVCTYTVPYSTTSRVTVHMYIGTVSTRQALRTSALHQGTLHPFSLWFLDPLPCAPRITGESFLLGGNDVRFRSAGQGRLRGRERAMLRRRMGIGELGTLGQMGNPFCSRTRSRIHSATDWQSVMPQKRRAHVAVGRELCLPPKAKLPVLTRYRCF
jgi:hypothetical protein